MDAASEFWRAVLRKYVREFPLQRGKSSVIEATARLYASAEEQIQELPGGARICLDLHEHVQRWIYFFGVYEARTVAWFQNTLRPGMTVLDIGSHVGQYSLIAATHVGESGHVHAFEPNPITFQRLRANIALNGFRHVHAHQIALSDQDGESLLYVPKSDNLGEASLQKCEPGSDATMVRCMTLDQWVRSDGFVGSKVDVIKMDVQGFEAKVITGAREVLQKFRPTILCEFEERWLNGVGASSIGLKATLRDLGYRAHRIVPGGLVPVEAGTVHAFENLVLIPSN